MSKTLVLVGILCLILSAVGCNTIEGVGKDVKETGQAIEKAAQKNK